MTEDDLERRNNVKINVYIIVNHGRMIIDQINDHFKGENMRIMNVSVEFSEKDVKREIKIMEGYGLEWDDMSYNQTKGNVTYHIEGNRVDEYLLEKIGNS